MKLLKTRIKIASFTTAISVALVTFFTSSSTCLAHDEYYNYNEKDNHNHRAKSNVYINPEDLYNLRASMRLEQLAKEEEERKARTEQQRLLEELLKEKQQESKENKLHEIANDLKLKYDEIDKTVSNLITAKRLKRRAVSHAIEAAGKDYEKDIKNIAKELDSAK